MKPLSQAQKHLLKLTRFLLLVSFSVCVNPMAYAQFDFNANCIKAYDQIIALNFEAGTKILENEKKINPSNNIPVFLENYIDFLTLSIGEELSAFEKLKPNRATRLAALSAATSGSPWKQHCAAAVYLQWAFTKAKFGEYISAGLDMNRAFRLLEKNEEQHPGFVPDLMLAGVMNALLGSIPENYQWAVNLAGWKGNIETGRRKLYELVEIAETNSEWAHLQPEAFFYLSFIEINLQSDKQHVSALTERMERTAKPAPGAFGCYIKANLNKRLGRNDEVISILEHCKTETSAYPFHYLSLILGNAKLNRLDLAAQKHLLHFVNHYKGLNYIKSAYQRLAWSSLIQGDPNAYKYYINLIRQNGQTFVDEDKQAQAEAEKNRNPNVKLLKARLLFDGGSYENALKLLETEIKSEDLPQLSDSVEFLYRKARIYHELGRTQAVIGQYLTVLEKGSKLPEYYAGNSALQLGLIYENSGDYSKATYYYEMCMSLKFTEYRTSIQQKAKVGLSRISKK